MNPTLFEVGDIIEHCYGVYAHRTYEFARVIKITPTGKFRIAILNKVKVVARGWDDTVVRPGENMIGENKLLTAEGMYGRGTMQEFWTKYNPEKECVDHYDRDA